MQSMEVKLLCKVGNCCSRRPLLTSVKTKDDFCTYCQNFSTLQWLSLTASRLQSYKSIKVHLINYYNCSIIFFLFWGLQVSHTTLQWGQIIVRASLTFQLDLTHSVFQNHNYCPLVSKLNTHCSILLPHSKLLYTSFL